MSQESSFWTMFGKISAVITTIAALVGIWVVFNQASEDLELYVSSGSYNLSPNLRKAISSNQEVFSNLELKEHIKKNVPEEIYQHEFDLIGVIQNLHKTSWGEINRYNYDKYRGLNYLRLTNTGNKTASDIEILFPVSGIATIIYPDDSTDTMSFRRIIKINDLRASSEISIAVWSEAEVSKYNYEDIKVTHTNGIGEVTWPINATGFSWYFAMYPYSTFLFLYIIFMLGLFVGMHGSKKNNEIDSSKSENT